LAILNLMWFEGALRTPWRMRDKSVGAGRRPPPVPPGALFLLLIAVVAALAYSIAGSGNHMLTSGLNDFVGRLPVDFVPGRDAYHGRGVYTRISQRVLNITLKASVAFGLLAA
jgi:hypothetical protein